MRREVTVEMAAENRGRCEICCEAQSRIIIGIGGVFEHHLCNDCFHELCSKMRAFDNGIRRRKRGSDTVAKG